MLSCVMLQWLKYFLAKFWDHFSSYASIKLSRLKTVSCSLDFLELADEIFFCFRFSIEAFMWND